MQIIFASLALLATIASAQTFTFSQSNEDEAEPVVQAQLLASLDRAYRGGELRVAVVARIKDGWHINSNRPLEDYLIPTQIAVNASNGVALKQTVFPAARERTFEFSDTPLAVFEGEFVIGAVLEVAQEQEGEILKLNGVLHYQACNDFACAAPDSALFPRRFLWRMLRSLRICNTQRFFRKSISA